jgi:hypothetical protein
VNGALFYSLLPFIEQQNVYNLGQGAINLGGGPYIGPWGARSQIIKTYLCPSDGTEPTNLDTNTGDGTWAVGNYAGNVMVFDAAANQLNGSKTIVNSMPDGTSNTVLFAHAIKTCSNPINANQYSATGTRDTDWAWYTWDGYYGQWDAPGFGFATYMARRGQVVCRTAAARARISNSLRAPTAWTSAPAKRSPPAASPSR